MFILSPEGKIIIDPNHLMIPAFKKIYDEDKSKTKEYAYSVFAGIYFLLDYKSPYQNYPEDEKEKEVIKAFSLDKDFIKKYKDALEEYSKLNKVPGEFLLEASKEGMYRIAKFIKSAPITAGKDGTLMQIQKAIEGVEGTNSAYNKLKKAVQEEQENKRKVGSTIIGSREE